MHSCACEQLAWISSETTVMARHVKAASGGCLVAGGLDGRESGTGRIQEPTSVNDGTRVDTS